MRYLVDSYNYILEYIYRIIYVNYILKILDTIFYLRLTALFYNTRYQTVLVSN